MATQSIFTNIIIDDPQKAEAFVNTLEKAKTISELYPIPKSDLKDMTKEEIRNYFGEKKNWIGLHN